MAALFLAFLTGCKGEKKDIHEETKRIFQIESVDEHTGLQRMQVFRVNQEVECKGKKFRLFIERTPSDALPKVKSDMGLFVDNQIKVKITRDNGTALCEKTFTKKDFASYISANSPVRTMDPLSSQSCCKYIVRIFKIRFYILCKYLASQKLRKNQIPRRFASVLHFCAVSSSACISSYVSPSEAESIRSPESEKFCM